jgi:hypothetical protein
MFSEVQSGGGKTAVALEVTLATPREAPGLPSLDFEELERLARSPKRVLIVESPWILFRRPQAPRKPSPRKPVDALELRAADSIGQQVSFYSTLECPAPLAPIAARSEASLE